MASWKVRLTERPPNVSIPIQFMRGLLYTQDCHKSRLATARFYYFIKLLKKATKFKFELARRGAHKLQRSSPSAAAHPGRQISGEVAFRGVRAANPTCQRPLAVARVPATAIHTCRAAFH